MMSVENTMNGGQIMRIGKMINTDTIRIKEEMRDEIAVQIREYLAKGGVITQIPRGMQQFDPKKAVYSNSIFQKGERK